MAFRRRVRPIRTRAETLRWGKRQGLGESSHSFRPCGAARARPYLDRGQPKPETALTKYTACEANHVGPLPVLFCRDLPEPGLDVLDRPVGDHELRHDDVAEVAEAAEVMRHDPEAPVAPSVAS